MSTVEVTEARLEQLLREAESEHADYEEHLGHRDEEWPAWYAAYIASRLQSGI